MYLVSVLPLSKKARTDNLSYFYGSDIPLGTIIEVPFRGKPMRAMVLETRSVEDVKSAIKGASFQIKKVTKVLPQCFPKELFNPLQSLAQFYLTPLSKMIDDVVPEAIIEHLGSVTFNQTNENTPLPALFVADTEERIGWYKTRIRELFAQKKSMYISAPTEREAETLFGALTKGIEEHAILITSGLPKKKFEAALKKILTSEHPLCIFGTPSYATVPRIDLDTIVLEHESSQNYRRVVAPFTDMRLYIELYAKARKCSLIFADTIARVETYQRFIQSELTEIRPIMFHPELPTREMIIAREPRVPRTTFAMFGEKMEAEIARAGEARARTFLFALRNGLASMTACRDCGEVLVCEYCDAPLALYKTGDKRVFICNACKRHTPTDSSCKRCGSWNLHPYGIGVESVYEECLAKFPDRPCFRLDRGSVKNDKEARAVMEAFETSENGILIGTELALHYFTQKIPLVGIVSLDSLFYIPSFRVSERIVDLVTNIRDRVEKIFMIQTVYPDDQLLTITSKPRLTSWYARELEERKEFNYPPYTTLIKVVGFFPRNSIMQAKESLATELTEWNPDIFTGNAPDDKRFAKLVALIRLPKKEWWFPELGKGTYPEKLELVLRSLQDKYAILVNPEDIL